MSQRLDYQHIAQWITPGARVLDLGCADGELLCHLREQRGTRGIGVDMNSAQLTRCMARGLQVVHTDIRRDLSLFADRSFDYVILSQTLQSIDQPPQKLLSEMLRVGAAAVVSFPNFAYYPLRLQMLAGTMPTGGSLPYAWHNTPNVRYCTINDFEQWCTAQHLVISGRVCLRPQGVVKHFPNLLAETAIYRLAAKGGKTVAVNS